VCGDVLVADAIATEGVIEIEDGEAQPASPKIELTDTINSRASRMMGRIYTFLHETRKRRLTVRMIAASSNEVNGRPDFVLHGLQAGWS
jgi:hypothetical protein